MLPTLGSHPLQPRYTRWHATHGGTPPTLARIAYHFSNSSDAYQRDYCIDCNFY